MRIFLLIAVMTLLAGCAAQPFAAGHASILPGFWWGLLHGVIAPVSLIGSFFSSEIRAYAAPNAGWWYDLGFVFGLSALMSTTRR